MLLSMAMTTGRFQGREFGQRDLPPVPLSEARAEELLEKLGGRGAAPQGASSQAQAYCSGPRTISPAGFPPFEDVPGLELVLQMDVIDAIDARQA